MNTTKDKADEEYPSIDSLAREAPGQYLVRSIVKDQSAGGAFVTLAIAADPERDVGIYRLDAHQYSDLEAHSDIVWQYDHRFPVFLDVGYRRSYQMLVCRWRCTQEGGVAWAASLRKVALDPDCEELVQELPHTHFGQGRKAMGAF